jgi:hypothetical protein
MNSTSGGESRRIRGPPSWNEQLEVAEEVWKLEDPLDEEESCTRFELRRMEVGRCLDLNLVDTSEKVI